MNFIWSKSGRAISRHFSEIDKSVYYSYCVMTNDWQIISSPLSLKEALLKLLGKTLITAKEYDDIKEAEIGYLKTLDKN